MQVRAINPNPDPNPNPNPQPNPIFHSGRYANTYPNPRSPAVCLGKTTLLSQLSIDFAKQNKPVLWGSFEIRNERLIHKMLMQVCTHSLP